jgi:hypothetical protein
MRPRIPVFTLVLSIALAVPVAAIQVPQTRREFVQAVAEGRGATKMETLVAERGIDQVYGLLERKSSACLDKEVKRSGFVGNQMEVSSSDYNPTLKRAGKNKAEFALQVVHRPRGVGHTPPPGGLYIMAADLKALAKDRTEVVLYIPTIGFKNISKTLRLWAAGEDADCPKLK